MVGELGSSPNPTLFKNIAIVSFHKIIGSLAMPNDRLAVKVRPAPNYGVGGLTNQW